MALLVEVAYQFDWYGSTVLKVTPLVFLWIFLTSVAGLRTTWQQTARGKKTGILASLLILISAALTLYIALGLLLPGLPITEAKIQSYTAHGAYLKSVCYFLPLAVIFLIVPFHFVVAARSELRDGPRRPVLALLSGRLRGTAPRGTIFLRPWWLGSLLFGCLAMSLVMTAHLFDNLKPHAYMNLFMQLVQWRGLLYFTLGVECVLWYAWSLSEIKHEHAGPVLKIGSSVEA